MENPILSTVGGMLEQLAPTIATALGGPFAGMAVRALEGALGLTPGAGADAVTGAMQSASPEQLVAIKKAELEFQLGVKQLDVNLEQISAADRNSARDMQKVTRDRTPDILAYMLTLGFFGLLAFMAWHDVPDGAKALLNVMIGFLGTAWVGAMSFFYGTTRGSQNKDAMLFNSAPTGSGQ